MGNVLQVNSNFLVRSLIWRGKAAKKALELAGLRFIFIFEGKEGIPFLPIFFDTY